MTRSMSQAVRIPVICNVKFLYEAVEQWRSEVENPGSELWANFHSDELYYTVRKIWADRLSEPVDLFPWRKEVVTFLVAKIRKEGIKRTKKKKS